MNPLFIEVSPHLSSEKNAAQVMRDVIIALLPAIAAGIFMFGNKSCFILLTSVFCCCASEFLFIKALKRKSTLKDLSAVVTGILFALTLPASTPLWVAAVGAVFAILAGKQFFGGLGHNPFNPALVGRAFIELSWPKQLVLENNPLVISKYGFDGVLPSYINMFIGNMPGGIGEISKLALIAGAMYLVFRRQVNFYIPVSLVLAFAGTILFFKGNPLMHVLTGGVILGAFFMATDPVTSPVSDKGKAVFGICCGVLAAVIRLKGAFPEGIYYSILIMNMFTPLIDKITRLKRFGAESV